MFRILDERDRSSLEHYIEAHVDSLDNKIEFGDQILSQHIELTKTKLQVNIDTTKQELQGKIDELKSQHETDSSTLTDSIARLKSQHDVDKETLENTITTLESKHDSDKLELDKSILDLSLDIYEESTRATEAETKIATDATNYTDALANGQVATNKTDIANLTQTVADNKTELSNSINTEVTRATSAENGLSSRIAAMEAFFKEADIDASKDFIDTLKEIQSYISSDKTGATEMAASIQSNKNNIESLASSKVDKDGNKVLTDNNLTNNLKTSYDTAYTHSQLAHAPADAEKNVQANFNESDTTSAAYILNKPGIASADNIGLVKVGSGLSIDSNTGELSAQVDLSNYYTKTEVDALIANILLQIQPSQ